MKQSVAFFGIFVTLIAYYISGTNSQTQFESIGESYAYATVCPCDMTAGTCDVYCCCDEDCSQEFKKSFRCLGGVLGGNQIPNLQDWLCNNSDSFKVFHFRSLLCIHRMNSPYLGHYFIHPQDIRDLPTLNDVITRKSSSVKSSFDLHPSDYSALKFYYADGYVFGQHLEVQIITAREKKRNKLTFPFSVFNGDCSFISYVQFLHDTSSTCIVSVARLYDVLMTNPFLRAKTFEIGDLAGKYLLRSPSNDNDFVNVNILYFYVVDACCYLKSMSCTLQKNCSKIQMPHFRGLGNEPIVFNNTISNIVMEVQYNFTWKDAKLHFLDITVILGNISLVHYGFDPLSAAVQRFSISYNHFQKSDCETNCSSVLHQTRSGNPGYEMGYPLITAENLVHSTSVTEDFFLVNKTYSRKHIYISKQDVSGKCVFDDGVKFGHDRTSGCIFHLKFGDFSNCSRIRQRVLERQFKILDVHLISKGGDPDFDNENDFVTLIREESLENVTRDDTSSSSSERGSCKNIPHHVRLDVIYTEVDRIRGRPVYKIIGAVRRLQRTRWRFHCGEHVRCHGDTSVAFPLTGSIHFTFVSSQRNNRTKRFWTSEIPVEQCKEETCWREVMYPMTSSFTLHDIYQVANYILLIILFLIPAIVLKLQSGFQRV